ncbi:Potassium-transporting ATPase potassium-binding subunit [Bienertia sinuspersici]
MEFEYQEWVLLIMVFGYAYRNTLGIQEMFSCLLADGCLFLLQKLLFSSAMDMAWNAAVS